MKLYHATSIENMHYILKEGLMPQISDKLSSVNDEERILVPCVFGFTSVDEAFDFANDNNYNKIVIFEIDATGMDIVLDPEYKGYAYAIITDDNIPATIALIIDRYEDDWAEMIVEFNSKQNINSEE